ncbi:hypothetical protein AQ809_08025 [Burkholderia pseudomallei]|nr:hypothetical protein BFR05_07905 [Burkholderia pseudomallei]APF97796.1 hypothetical protein BFR06_07915 [Burkholderia pseudomallei]OMW38416.1 hypothetical protein AQ809_08025 [Burkholderia pseudomallei]ONC55236.1 hypothetical protein AQ919_21525 [Burkholderia pseudomallei]ONC69606.1 hypothetical protein AQ921_20345 [Burkholderia pseudomallei]
MPVTPARTRREGAARRGTREGATQAVSGAHRVARRACSHAMASLTQVNAGVNGRHRLESSLHAFATIQGAPP